MRQSLVTSLLLAAVLLASTVQPAGAAPDVNPAPTNVTLAPHSAEAKLDRLYQAFFERLADNDGLTYWVGVFENGVSLNAISEQLAQSPEFIATYGELTDRDFVELVYQNVLGRAGEPSGILYWTAEIDAGRVTRGTLMASFTESSEHIASNSDAYDDSVERLYFAYFDRTPDADGLKYWVGLYLSGVSLDQVSELFAQSVEFTSTYGELEAREFVELVYDNVFGREGEPDGVDYWTSQIDQGLVQRGTLMARFSESSEYLKILTLRAEQTRPTPAPLPDPEPAPTPALPPTTTTTAPPPTTTTTAPPPTTTTTAPPAAQDVRESIMWLHSIITGRPPSPEAINYWATQIADGTTLEQFADELMALDLAQNSFSSWHTYHDGDFVKFLAGRVFTERQNRPNLEHWENELSQDQLSRAELLVLLSGDSARFQVYQDPTCTLENIEVVRGQVRSSRPSPLYETQDVFELRATIDCGSHVLSYRSQVVADIRANSIGDNLARSPQFIHNGAGQDAELHVKVQVTDSLRVDELQLTGSIQVVDLIVVTNHDLDEFAQARQELVLSIPTPANDDPDAADVDIAASFASDSYPQGRTAQILVSASPCVITSPDLDTLNEHLAVVYDGPSRRQTDFPFTLSSDSRDCEVRVWVEGDGIIADSYAFIIPGKPDPIGGHGCSLETPRLQFRDGEGWLRTSLDVTFEMHCGIEDLGEDTLITATFTSGQSEVHVFSMYRPRTASAEDFVVLNFAGPFAHSYFTPEVDPITNEFPLTGTVSVQSAGVSFEQHIELTGTFPVAIELTHTVESDLPDGLITESASGFKAEIALTQELGPVGQHAEVTIRSGSSDCVVTNVPAHPTLQRTYVLELELPERTNIMPLQVDMGSYRCSLRVSIDGVEIEYSDLHFYVYRTPNSPTSPTLLANTCDGTDCALQFSVDNHSELSTNVGLNVFSKSVIAGTYEKRTSVWSPGQTGPGTVNFDPLDLVGGSTICFRAEARAVGFRLARSDLQCADWNGSGWTQRNPTSEEQQYWVNY